MAYQDRYRKRESIVYREEEDGAFLFDPDTGNLKFMNRTGRETFLMLDGRSSVDHLLQRLRETYPDAEPLKIRQDVESFLIELVENDFIAVSENS